MADMAPTSTEKAPTASPNAEFILIGAVLAIFGNLMISVSMNIQRYSHVKLAEEKSEKDYFKSKIWWVGLILMVLGEVGNFSAYGFAPASLVAPLGTTTVIANAVIAVVFLKERLRPQDIFGVTLAIVGAFLIITFSTKTSEELVGDEIFQNCIHWPFVIYLVVEICTFASLVYVQKKFNMENVVIDLSLVALLGSLTVIAAKAVSSMINITLQGHSQLGHPMFWIMLLVMIVTAIAQVRFLNHAMKSFDATVVVPTNFVFFTISAILGGVFFYREFYGLTFLEIFMFVFGCVLSFIGVYCITSERQTDGGDGDLKLISADLFPGCVFCCCRAKRPSLDGSSTDSAVEIVCEETNWAASRLDARRSISQDSVLHPAPSVGLRKTFSS